MTSRFAIADGVASAVRFLGPAWKQAWAAMLVSGFVFAAFWALRLWTPESPWRLEALTVAVLATLMAQGGLYRLALNAGKPGPAGLQWGRLEWRLSAVWGLTALFLSVLGLLACVVVLALAFGVASSGYGFVVVAPSTWARAVDGRGRIILSLSVAAASAGLFWAATRISLGAAASVARGRVQVLASWPDTRGISLRILLARLVLAAAPVGLASAILITASRVSDDSGMVGWASGVAAGAVIAGVWIPLSVGLTAFFYREASASGEARVGS
jgi:hypothetical protein